MKIAIKGPIISDGEQFIYDWFGIPATSPVKVLNIIEEAIQNKVNELTVVINSGGGSVFSASEIYTELKKFEGNVNVEIVGMAASAASVIAMAGTKIVMSPTGQLMIHNASTTAWGDYRDMNHTGEFLQKVNQSIMNSYTAKTGKATDELKALMDAETWMTAQDAKEAGFVDAIMFEQEVEAKANVERPDLVNGMLPQEVINKMREQLANDKSLTVVNSATQPAKHIKDKGNGVSATMNIETLKNEHPELFEQVKNIGFEEGKKVENQRIKEIEEITVAGSHDIVKAAKFENGMSAGEVAMAILKNEKNRKENLLIDRKDDATLVNGVINADFTPPDKENEFSNTLDKVLGGKKND
ncbi:head maturation protease, ClpP-related [Viridibacillus arvi]|uniref:head maturation protease, ClpP-related n=1 Tax=Viridibacillus arvi TaxID=263475 RepID=UPI0034CE487C